MICTARGVIMRKVLYIQDAGFTFLRVILDPPPRGKVIFGQLLRTPTCTKVKFGQKNYLNTPNYYLIIHFII